ncbi:restriction endonuclease subunit S [Empedobacter falsenii]
MANDYFLAFDSGSGQTNLRRDEVLNCPIDFPSLSEQECIATILSDMDAELESLENQLAKARQIKQGMMQELLTGRTRLV